uniref:Uncharacterized protein n=1 Tax=Pyramimonas obovata TaxID=1411642 RepID=A0A7S0MZ50_9CHLO|mmetsp:Transcript_16888/g.36736  ORF Transcript_16888/g.36736 Transcript_16888/m.36736 type:complete len:486 (+) Transcript_16888:3-1460(+)
MIARETRCATALVSESSISWLGPRPRHIKPRQQPCDGRQRSLCTSRRHLLRIQSPRIASETSANARTRYKTICSSAFQADTGGDTLLQALTLEQQMALTEVVAKLVPLPLPHYISQKVVGEAVGNVSVILATQLTPKLRRAVMQGRTLSDSEMNELCDILTSSIDVPLLPKSSARPLFRSVVESLFGPHKIKVIDLDWNAVLSAGIGLENTQYRERLAMDLAAAFDVPGMREDQRLATANWVLKKTSDLAGKILPPKLLPLLRASSTKDLERMRPSIAASIFEAISNVPLGVGVILPKNTKEKLANKIVDNLYENYINKSPARLRLMSPSERENYEIESLRGTLADLERTQESLQLQTRLAISQLWHNHWKKVSLTWILRGKITLRMLRKIAIFGLALGFVAGVGCLICLGLGRWDLVMTVQSAALHVYYKATYFASLMIAYSATTYTQVIRSSQIAQTHIVQVLLAAKMICLKGNEVFLSFLGR